MEQKQVGYYLERTTRIVKLSFHQAIAKLGLDITPEQWVIMEYLFDNQGLSQVQLANKSFKNAPTISRILDVLSRKGYIERVKYAEDKRRREIHLTEDGKKAVDQIRPTVADLRELGWQNLSDEDYETFLRIMNQVFSNYESFDN